MWFILTGEQAHVRKLFCETFGVVNDEDFSLHQPPTAQELKEFKDGGPGPNPEDLRLDMKGPKSSNWNKRVAEILLEDLLGRKAAEKNWSALPDRTEAYFLDLIEDKIQRVKIHWRSAQIKLKETGEVECPEEVESRMICAKKERAKKSRVATRRRMVS